MYRKEKLKNMPSGHDGDGYIEINRRLVPGFIISKASVNVEAITSSKKFLSERVTQNAVRGLEIKGSISYLHRTSALMQAISDYKEGGDYPDITIQTWAEVSGSGVGSTGRCEVLLTGVILKTVGLAGLDDSSDDVVVFETEITADDFSVLSKFNEVK